MNNNFRSVIQKIQTAIEYSCRVRELTLETWVFWIHASNAARLRQGYQQVAGVAKISGRDDQNMKIPPARVSVVIRCAQWALGDGVGQRG